LGLRTDRVWGDEGREETSAMPQSIDSAAISSYFLEKLIAGKGRERGCKGEKGMTARKASVAKTKNQVHPKNFGGGKKLVKSKNGFLGGKRRVQVTPQYLEMDNVTRMKRQGKLKGGKGGEEAIKKGRGKARQL